MILCTDAEAFSGLAPDSQNKDFETALWLSISMGFKRRSIGGSKVKMACSEQKATEQATLYASGADFCRIFEEQMSRLYLLSFLLTADYETAVECFVGGLEDCQKANTVFKEWTESWARRTIVQNAIRTIQPRPGRLEPITGSTTGLTTTGPIMITAIARLSVFERFVFVMSVLESYTDQECSLLLNTTRGEVVSARTHALQQVTTAAEVTPVSIAHPLYVDGSNWQTT
jgi:DNA-directed RNA polymerase specialized sigma24 family protein